MTDLLITGIILLSIGAAVAYIWRSKKNGVKCIGCPSGCKCSGKEGESVRDCRKKDIRISPEQKLQKRSLHDGN